MTIPTLVSKIQEAHFHAKWKEYYAILNNAFKMVVAENPRMVVTAANEYDLSKEFIEAILSHLQVVDTCTIYDKYETGICDNYSSWSDKDIKYKWSALNVGDPRYKTLSGAKLRGYDFGLYAALLKNGASIYFGGSHSGSTILVDVNNFNGGPNILGKDLYAIHMCSGIILAIQYIEDLYFKPSGDEGTRTEKEGYAGCDESIGSNQPNYIFESSGAGCSYKYLHEK